MKITPVAADSLGARSMATLVETEDVCVLIDPSVRLAPYRYDLTPHPTEEDRQRELWREIRDAAKRADVLTVSHYHFDHHNPKAPSIFRGKLALLKDGSFHINRSQRERASVFVRALKKYPKEIQVADGHIFDFGKTQLTFSPAVPHGFNDELGYVVMTRISEGTETFLHTSDVLGPPLKAHLSFILDSEPSVLYVDGPMTHMPENYPEARTRQSITNLLRIVRSTAVETVIVDHHALRDRAWQSWIEPVLRAGEDHGVQVRTAAGFLGMKTDQLEANRDVLYGLPPRAEDHSASAKEP